MREVGARTCLLLAGADEAQNMYIGEYSTNDEEDCAGLTAAIPARGLSVSCLFLFFLRFDSVGSRHSDVA